ncbi:MAG: DUF5777 family beta-barrel protein [Candidatus Moduliflexus flocculans]|nr:DUF5777 family beta-barrel protein [Candidatus Moduliflexus flocculans]
MKVMKALLSILVLGPMIRPATAAQGPVWGEDGREAALTAGEKTAGTAEAKAEAQETPAPRKMPFETPAFWGTRLVNLPTTTTIDAKDLLFRISHRFYGPVAEGYDTFFGLDSGANVFFSLGYGITGPVLDQRRPGPALQRVGAGIPTGSSSNRARSRAFPSRRPCTRERIGSRWKDRGP